MAYDTTKIVTLGQLQDLAEAVAAEGYQTSSQVESAIATAIADKGTASFEVVTTLPTATTAKSNVLYLYLNSTTGYYDIYALVSGEVLRIDDTTVDLSNYYTKTQVDSAISSGTVAVANKLGTTTVGSASRPIYLNAGAPTAITGALATTYGGTGTTTGHIAITQGTDTTSTASPAHGGTFTAIDSVTKDSYGHVTAVNIKTVTLPADNNTDTKVSQAYGTATGNYPILASATAGVTATTSRGATTAILNNSVYMDPSTGTITATKFSGALSGNATTATTLATARTIQTNLGSTTAASFNGSANVAPGVTGTLALANGGTGATTAAAARTNLGLGNVATYTVATDAEVAEMITTVFG